MTDFFDEKSALERVDGDREFLREILGVCVEDSAKKFVEISTAFSQNDLKLVSSIAHSMKSAYGNVGAMVCHSIAATLERAAKQNDDATARDALSKLVAEGKRFEEFAKTY